MPNVNVVTPVAAKVNIPPKLVIPLLLIVKLTSVVLPLDIIVPVLRIVTVNEVNVLVADNVKLLRFTEVTPIMAVMVPKLSRLNQLPVDIVGIAVPDPVKVKLGALDTVPPLVLPKANVLAIPIAEVKPPVPVQEKPVGVAMERTVPPAASFVNTILVAPNVIAHVLDPPANTPQLKV